MSKPLSAVMAVAVLALAACGGSAPGASSAPPAGTPAAGATATPVAATPATTDTATSIAPGDPCAVLTADDLKTVIGAEYEAGVLDDFGLCTWQGEPLVVMAFQEVSIDFAKSSFTGGEDATVSGKTAYWHPAQGYQSLWVDVGGGWTLVLSFPKTEPGPAELAFALQLAEIAVGRM